MRLIESWKVKKRAEIFRPLFLSKVSAPLAFDRKTTVNFAWTINKDRRTINKDRRTLSKDRRTINKDRRTLPKDRRAINRVSRAINKGR
ncbi:MAG TPA: hypothetical protein PKE69_26865 [Pyrinomonadaceae bacterium]|nr:hypothetical protein [Pyrinomonadaceae bacterium]